MNTHTTYNSAQFEIRFQTRGLQPQCLPDLRFPDGVTLDVTDGKEPSCTVELPYPAKCIGAWLIVCRKCGQSVACTAAGRFDDPRTLKMPCKRV